MQKAGLSRTFPGDAACSERQFILDQSFVVCAAYDREEPKPNGCGGAIAKHLEAELKERGQRILIADTSGTDEFAQTREFYRKNGYAEEARIRDFWAAGDDKVVFWKSLS